MTTGENTLLRDIPTPETTEHSTLKKDDSLHREMVFSSIDLTQEKNPTPSVPSSE